MKKKVFVLLLALGFTVPTMIDASEITGTWATRNEGILEVETTEELTGRYVLENSLYEADVIANNYSDNSTFTGVGYYNSVTYYFHKIDENNAMTHYGKLVNNPDTTVPDLRLTEVTWGNDNSTWSAEGVAIYAVNYNETGEEKLIAYAYNKVAQKRANAYVSDEYPDGYVLPYVDGTSVEYTFADTDSEARNLYDTLVYFNDEFESADAIKLVDITEDLKFLGGEGQADSDGYDLDAIYGYRVIMTSVTQDVTYIIEAGLDEFGENDSVLYEDLETYSDYSVLPNMFEKDGYTFVAWATEGTGLIYGDLTEEDIPNYSTEYNYYAPGYSINLDDSYTFYGVWKEDVIEEEPEVENKPTCGDKDYSDKKPTCGDKNHSNKKPTCGNISVMPNKKPTVGHVSVKPNNKYVKHVSFKQNTNKNTGNCSCK